MQECQTGERAARETYRALRTSHRLQLTFSCWQTSTHQALSEVWQNYDHTPTSAQVLPRNAGQVQVLIMDYSLTSFHISCPYLLHFPSVSFFCSRPPSTVVYFFNPLTSTMRMKPFLPSSCELPCAAALSLTCAQMAGPPQQEPVMSILHGP